jgi:hypothetical protein
MKTTWIILILVAFLLSGCGSESAPAPTSEIAPTQPKSTVPAAVSAGTPRPTPQPTAGLPLPLERGELFAASGVCSVCHTNNIDEGGANVSVDTSWRSSMMANSTRDPYWRATFSSEQLKHPDYQAVIEDKCLACHAPMAHTTAVADGEAPKGFDGGFLTPDHPLYTLALDGISCTLCHQILGTNFGQAESFSGHYAIDTEVQAGQREVFGPFPVEASQAAAMQGSSGFVPREEQHVRQSELCAVCHTLYTPFLDANGQIAGEFPEQTPYLEWQASDYAGNQSCQDCHMPQAQGGVVLSVTGGERRSPFHQHPLTGGNAFVLGMLLQYSDVLETTATRPQFSAAIQRVLDQLQNRTATVVLENTRVSGTRLSADVVIESQAGHKLPTAYPSRRVWLHFVVRDSAGNTVFESGAANPDGSIVGNDNDADPAAYEPHYELIESADQVQIYEAIMGDSDGGVTTTLLRGASYLKDNRLLPSGFRDINPDIAVNGQAAEDPAFVAGGHRTHFDVLLDEPAAPGPYTVTVELMYQTIGYRWANNLGQLSSPEIDRFVEMEKAMTNQPIVVDRAVSEVEG